MSRFVISHGHRMIEPDPHDFLVFECSTHVAASPERVFALVGDLGRSVEWAGSGDIVSIAQTTKGPVGVGTRYRSQERITMPYRADIEIIAYRPPELIVWKSKPAGEQVPYHRWAFLLRLEDGGTLLVHRVRATRAFGVMGWIQRLGFVFTRPKRRIPLGMERTLANVKALAEGGEVTGEG